MRSIGTPRRIALTLRFLAARFLAARLLATAALGTLAARAFRP